MTTPSDPAFWPETMTRNGVTLTRDQMAAAWRDWSTGPGVRTYVGLTMLIDHWYVEGEQEGFRMADAMLQRARKAGFIEYVEGEWRVIDVEQSQ